MGRRGGEILGHSADGWALLPPGSASDGGQAGGAFLRRDDRGHRASSRANRGYAKRKRLQASWRRNYQSIQISLTHERHPSSRAIPTHPATLGRSHLSCAVSHRRPVLRSSHLLLHDLFLGSERAPAYRFKNRTLGLCNPGYVPVLRTLCTFFLWHLAACPENRRRI